MPEPDWDCEHWSNVSIGGNRLTWPEKAQRDDDYHSQAEALIALLYDLDRCQHGRHEGDSCSGCGGGPSRGNPLLGRSRQIGFDISGRPIVVPKRGADQRDPKAWIT